jgi:hypothetical protein
VLDQGVSLAVHTTVVLLVAGGCAAALVGRE